MALIEMLTRGAFGLRAESGGDGNLRFADPRAWHLFGGGGFGAGMRINADSVKRIACAQACVGIIARNVGAMPLKVFSEDDAGDVFLAKECPEYQMLYARPNDRQTSVDFKQMLQGHFELHGNGYAEKVMNRRDVTQQLLPMHPNRVTPEVLSSGRMRYRYADPLTNTTRILVQEQVFHLRNWSDDGYVGQSTIAMGADVFGVALAAQDYTARFFQNDAKPGLYFQSEANAPKFKSDQDKEAFRENWRRSQTGANRHKVAFVPPGLTLKEFGIKPNDAQLLDARKFSRIEICSLFGVPPHLVGETEKAATYASVEQFNIMFATQCLLPRIVTWEQTIQRDILQDEAFSARFSMAALLRGDNASRTAAYAVGIQNGWLCQNDVRIMEGLNPIPGGNVYTISSAMVPIGSTTKPSQSQRGGGSGASEELDELESDDTKRAQHVSDLRHNVQVLQAMAGKERLESTRALLELR